MAIDQEHFKEKLEAEKKLLEKELSEVGRRNPDNPRDWEAVPADQETTTQADENLAADHIEGYEDNLAIVESLETRYTDVKDALEKLEKGNYGICEIGGEEIEIDRLEANPSARTCKEHMNGS